MKWMYKEEKPFGKSVLIQRRILNRLFKIRNETGRGSEDQRKASRPRPRE